MARFAWCAIVALVAAVPAQAKPPAARYAPPELPPYVELRPANSAAQARLAGQGDGDRQAVLFAGQTVEFLLPAGWSVRETACGRDVALLVGPDELPETQDELEAGLWLTYRRQDSPGPPRRPLADEVLAAARQSLGSVEVAGPPRQLEISTFPGTQLALAIPARAQADVPVRASHLLIRSAWGVLELHGRAPLTADDEVRRGLAEILDTLTIHEPLPLPPPRAITIRDAAAAIGNWKGDHCRLELTPDGRIAIRADEPARDDTVEYAAGDDSNEPLSGRFQAEGDLIYVRWSDGSLSNYRWTLHEGELLLTDHTGVNVGLRRLFDQP